jgi:hypothetical protein
MVLSSYEYNQHFVCIFSLLTDRKKTYPYTSDVSKFCSFPVTEIRISFLALRTRGLALPRGSGTSCIQYRFVRLTETALCVCVCVCVCVEKGPAADTTDSPLPYGFLCNHVMKLKRRMISFFLFIQVSARGMKLIGENRSTRGKPVPLPLRPAQIPHGLTRDRTRASTVGGRRLAA